MAHDPDYFTRWPLPIGRVTTLGDLTYVYSSERGGFSAEELRRIPDDRVELVDGVVLVRPALTAGQRQVMDDFFRELCERCPKHLVPSNGRLDVQIREATVFRPDIQVLTRDGAEGPRVLVAEVMPGHGRRCTRADKRDKLCGYRDAGIMTYWAVDPDEFLVAVYDLDDARKGSCCRGDARERGQRYWWRMWAWAV